jgi:hypothetical protein
MLTRRRLSLAVAGLLWASLAAAGGRLDEGLLDPGWFGEGVEFRTTERIDYLWVKPGFSFKGHKVHAAAWADPVFLQGERDAKDAAKAEELTDLMAGRVRGALSVGLEGIAEVSREEGDLRLEGRFVDVNAGSRMAKMLVGWGAGSATATWDMKLIDTSTGEIVWAIHHRSVSGTSISNIEDKVVKWLQAFADEARRDFASYHAARPARK